MGSSAAIFTREARVQVIADNPSMALSTTLVFPQFGGQSDYAEEGHEAAAVLAGRCSRPAAK